MLNPASRTDVVSLLQALALTDGVCYPTAIRIGHDPERRHTYVDLGTQDWSVIEVTSAGWRVIQSEQCPFRMLRSSAMHSLRYRKSLFSAFHSARPRDHGERWAADGGIAARECDDGVIRFDIAADEFIRLGDSDQFLHAGHLVERAWLHGP